MVHMLAAIMSLVALGGGMALIGYTILSRLDAIVTALHPLPEPTRVMLVNRRKAGAGHAARTAGSGPKPARLKRRPVQLAPRLRPATA